MAVLFYFETFAISKLQARKSPLEADYTSSVSQFYTSGRRVASVACKPLIHMGWYEYCFFIAGKERPLQTSGVGYLVFCPEPEKCGGRGVLYRGLVLHSNRRKYEEHH